MTFEDSEDKDSDTEQKGKKIFQHHGTCRHITDQCTILNALVKQAKQKRSKQFGKKKITKHKVNVMVQKLAKKAWK